jgi:hypothetical protein
VRFDVSLKPQYRIRLLFVPAEEGVACLAKQGADVSFGMAVIHEQPSCFAFTDRTSATLLYPHGIDLSNRQPVLMLEVTPFIDDRRSHGVLFPPLS